MGMTGWLPIGIALAALGVSLFNLWTTHLRRGRVCMTPPTVVYIGRDGAENRHKIYLRTLLFSTSVRGNVIESMHITVHQQPLDTELSSVFDYWAYGETGKLSVGGGLYVGQSGVALNHHFVLSRRVAQDFVWWNAPCRIQVFARVRGKRAPQLLHEVKIEISAQLAALLAQVLDAGVFFEWGSDATDYFSYAERRSARIEEVEKHTKPS
jgi:hypothetical protein